MDMLTPSDYEITKWRPSRFDSTEAPNPEPNPTQPDQGPKPPLKIPADPPAPAEDSKAALRPD